MNKGEIRTRILEQVDWQPDQSTAFKDKVDRLINRAYQQLSLEAPYLFFEDKALIVTEPDIEGKYKLSIVTETRETTTTASGAIVDRYILSSSGGGEWPGVPVGSPRHMGRLSEDHARSEATLAGRMLEITLADGTVQRREILHAWQETVDGKAQDHLAVTPKLTGTVANLTAMKYRIYTPAYGLPADVVELRSARIWDDRHSELEIETQYDMERYDYVDHRGQQSGRPQSLFRGPHKQIDAPVMAPEIKVKTTADDNSTGGWIGPLQQGTFEFCYTWAIGEIDAATEPHSGSAQPRWESAPSPISAPVSLNSGADYLEIRTIDINKVLDFGLTRRTETEEADGVLDFYAAGKDVLESVRRTSRSGYQRRIYIRRTDSVSTTVGPATDTRTLATDVGDSKVFHLLEQDYATPVMTEYRGEVPDYFERLKEVHGYQTVRFNPMPDARYEIDCRVLRRPAQLVADTDAPRIHEEAVQALLEKCLIYFYELQGSMELSQNAERRYADTLRTLTKRYAMLPRIRPSKKFARVRRAAREVRVRFKD